MKLRFCFVFIVSFLIFRSPIKIAEEMNSDILHIHGASYGRIAIEIDYELTEKISPFFKKQFLKNLKLTALFDFVDDHSHELQFKIKKTIYSGFVLSILTQDDTEVYNAKIVLYKNKTKQLEAIIDLIDNMMLAITGEKTILNSAILYSRREKDGRVNIILTDLQGFRKYSIAYFHKINILSRWSKNGHGFIFTNLSSQGSRILYYDFKTNKTKIAAFYKGTSAGGTWIDDQNIALAIGARQIVNIYKKNINDFSSKAVPLTRGWQVDTSPSITEDGRYLIFSSNREGSMNIFRKDLLLNQVDRYTFDKHYNSEPMLSHDNNFIVFTAGTLRNLKIHLMTKNGTFQTSISKISGNSFEPAWSPDDKQIIFTNKIGSRSKIYITTLDGTHIYRLTQDSNEFIENSAIWTNNFDWNLAKNLEKLY